MLSQHTNMQVHHEEAQTYEAHNSNSQAI
jgi:hypothetical protein